MKFILPNNAVHQNVAGRDIVDASTRKINAIDTTVGIEPLVWMKPRLISSRGITFGKGISYACGIYPTNNNTNFPAGRRICLIETLTPVSVSFSFFYPDGGYDVEGLRVESIIKDATLAAIPYPYTSTSCTLQAGNGTPEVRITVLGYANSSRGMAIGESVRFTHNDGTSPDYVTLNKYPYLIAPVAGYSTTEEADEYYYTDKEYTEALAP